jgi:Ser-tRNA(Ala) deacylase AlaX
MAVRKVFWEDPYRTEIATVLTCVSGETVTLESTIFYAFSGGQASDSGTINGFKVLEAQKLDNKEILYRLEPNHQLKTGDQVIVKIDWEKRYKIMRLHFAAEIILELVYQNYNHPEKIGANITEEKARVDFGWQGNISEIFPFIGSKAKEIIDADSGIISRFSDEEAEKRYWEIEGFAKVACGGTHLKRTSEVGNITLKRKNSGGGKERIEIYLQ